MSEKVCIFTEGGKEYGYGHITRCISLYDELELCGKNPILIINGNEFEGSFLGSRKHSLDNWYENVEDFIDPRCYAIVDSYHATKECCDAISNISRNTLFIDDYARIDYPKGVVVNPSVSGNQVEYSRKQGQTYLLGCDYIILRKEFQQPEERKIKDQVSDLLIMMGGADTAGVLPVILEELARSEYHLLKKHIVFAMSDYDAIYKYVLDANVKMYSCLNAKEIRQLMLKCDIAITAAGQTVYEMIATRLPFVCIKTADNQENNVKGLVNYNVIDRYILGHTNVDLAKDCINQLNQLFCFRTREEIADKMESILDGKGTKRIIKQLLV